MPDHDPDLIAALAEGRLGPEQAEAAMRAISTDQAALAELEAHRAALTAIRAAPAALLEDDERTRLRREVAAAVGMPTSKAEAPRRRRGIRWPAVAVAAATLVALVAVVPLTGILSGDENAAITAEAPVDRTSVGESAPEAQVPAAGADLPDGELGTEGDTEQASVATTTAMAAAADDLEPVTLYVGELLSGEETPATAVAATAETRCVDEAAALLGAEPASLTVVEATIDDAQALVFYTGEDGAVVAVAAYQPVECVLLASAP